MVRFVLFFVSVQVFWGSTLWAADPRIERADRVKAAIAQLCPARSLVGLDAQVAISGSWLLDERTQTFPSGLRVSTIRLVLPGGDEMSIERRQITDQLRQFRVTLFTETEDGPQPKLLAIADGGCTVRSGRELRDDGPILRYLDQLEGDLVTLRWSETVQAPWPDGQDPGGIRVGFVDSGLAYDLDIFRDRLGRDGSGTPLGYDYWDLDPWPYDGDVSRGPFLPVRHGTAVGSVFAQEAPDAAIVPFRYPRPDMARLGDLVDRAAAAGVRVLAMPLGSRDRSDWDAFQAALDRHDILAIVSAGNDGRNIDEFPIFPAGLPGEKILVVTSADAFGRLASGSNWGPVSVDLMVPAENVPVVDFRGASGTASGSSYAVPRVAALAARILVQQPDLTAPALRDHILGLAIPSPFEREDLLAVGWIANPLNP